MHAFLYTNLTVTFHVCNKKKIYKTTNYKKKWFVYKIAERKKKFTHINQGAARFLKQTAGWRGVVCGVECYPGGGGDSGGDGWSSRILSVIHISHQRKLRRVSQNQNL